MTLLTVRWQKRNGKMTRRHVVDDVVRDPTAVTGERTMTLCGREVPRGGARGFRSVPRWAMGDEACGLCVERL